MVDIEANKIELLPINDWVFKRIYGRKGSERITEDFIKTFLDLEVKIDELESEEPLETDVTSDKAGRLDVLVTTATGMKIDLEMQVWNFSDLEEKLSFYGCDLYTSRVKKGLKYKDVNKTIAVMILAGRNEKYMEYEDYRIEFGIIAKKYPELFLTRNIEFCIISLEKIKEQIAKGKIKGTDKIAIWTKFLLTPEELKEDEMRENEEIKDAKEIYGEFLGDENARLNAVRRHIHIMDMNAMKDDGIEEGENKAKREVAKKLLEKGIDIEIIIEATGLTKEEIEDLK